MNANGNEAAPPQDAPIEAAPSLQLTENDIMTSKLTMTRVEKAGYLAAVPQDKIGHLYAGDSYVIFCVSQNDEVRRQEGLLMQPTNYVRYAAGASARIYDMHSPDRGAAATATATSLHNNTCRTQIIIRYTHTWNANAIFFFVAFHQASNSKDSLCIYIWHGEMSALKTEDDAVFRAVRSSIPDGGDVNAQFLDCATQVKMVQGHEPHYFFRDFHKSTQKPVVTHLGGAYSGQYECQNYIIKSSIPYNISQSLFQLHISDDAPHGTAVLKYHANLNSEDCFVLVGEDFTYLWVGKSVSAEDAAMAHYMAGTLTGDPLSILKMTEGENEMEEFWHDIGGRGDYPAMRPKPEVVEGTGLWVPKGWEWTCLGQQYSTELLTNDSVVVLDAGVDGTFVWVGSNKVEVTGMFYKAVECLDSETRPVMVVHQEAEHPLFQSAFQDQEQIPVEISNEEKKIDAEDQTEPESTNDEKVIEMSASQECAESTHDTVVDNKDNDDNNASSEAGASENDEETIEKINTPAVLEGETEGDVTEKSEGSNIPKGESRSQNEGIDDTEEETTEDVSFEGDTAEGNDEPKKDVTEEPEREVTEESALEEVVEIESTVDADTSALPEKDTEEEETTEVSDDPENEVTKEPVSKETDDRVEEVESNVDADTTAIPEKDVEEEVTTEVSDEPDKDVTADPTLEEIDEGETSIDADTSTFPEKEEKEETAEVPDEPDKDVTEEPALEEIGEGETSIDADTSTFPEKEETEVSDEPENDVTEESVSEETDEKVVKVGKSIDANTSTLPEKEDEKETTEVSDEPENDVTEESVSEETDEKVLEVGRSIDADTSALQEKEDEAETAAVSDETEKNITEEPALEEVVEVESTVDADLPEKEDEEETAEVSDEPEKELTKEPVTEKTEEKVEKVESTVDADTSALPEKDAGEDSAPKKKKKRKKGKKKKKKKAIEIDNEEPPVPTPEETQNETTEVSEGVVEELVSDCAKVETEDKDEAVEDVVEEVDRSVSSEKQTEKESTEVSEEPEKDVSKEPVSDCAEVETENKDEAVEDVVEEVDRSVGSEKQTEKESAEVSEEPEKDVSKEPVSDCAEVETENKDEAVEDVVEEVDRSVGSEKQTEKESAEVSEEPETDVSKEPVSDCAKVETEDKDEDVDTEEKVEEVEKSVDVIVSDLLEKEAEEDGAAEVSEEPEKDVVIDPLVSDCMKIKTGDKDEAVEEVERSDDANASDLLEEESEEKESPASNESYPSAEQEIVITENIDNTDAIGPEVEKEEPTSEGTVVNEEGYKNLYSLDELMKPIDGVDWAQREDYLRDDEFKKTFGMERNEFSKLPKWKRQSAKKKVGLFQKYHIVNFGLSIILELLEALESITFCHCHS